MQIETPLEADQGGRAKTNRSRSNRSTKIREPEPFRPQAAPVDLNMGAQRANLDYLNKLSQALDGAVSSGVQLTQGLQGFKSRQEEQAQIDANELYLEGFASVNDWVHEKGITQEEKERRAGTNGWYRNALNSELGQIVQRDRIKGWDAHVQEVNEKARKNNEDPDKPHMDFLDSIEDGPGYEKALMAYLQDGSEEWDPEFKEGFNENLAAGIQGILEKAREASVENHQADAKKLAVVRVDALPLGDPASLEELGQIADDAHFVTQIPRDKIVTLLFEALDARFSRELAGEDGTLGRDDFDEFLPALEQLAEGRPDLQEKIAQLERETNSALSSQAESASRRRTEEKAIAQDEFDEQMAEHMDLPREELRRTLAPYALAAGMTPTQLDDKIELVSMGRKSAVQAAPVEEIEDWIKTTNVTEAEVVATARGMGLTEAETNRLRAAVKGRNQANEVEALPSVGRHLTALDNDAKGFILESGDGFGLFVQSPRTPTEIAKQGVYEDIRGQLVEDIWTAANQSDADDLNTKEWREYVRGLVQEARAEIAKLAPDADGVGLDVLSTIPSDDSKRTIIDTLATKAEKLREKLPNVLSQFATPADDSPASSGPTAPASPLTPRQAEELVDATGDVIAFIDAHAGGTVVPDSVTVLTDINISGATNRIPADPDAPLATLVDSLTPEARERYDEEVKKGTGNLLERIGAFAQASAELTERLEAESWEKEKAKRRALGRAANDAADAVEEGVGDVADSAVETAKSAVQGVSDFVGGRPLTPEEKTKLAKSLQGGD